MPRLLEHSHQQWNLKFSLVVSVLHRNIAINVPEVMQEFARLYSGRLELQCRHHVCLNLA